MEAFIIALVMVIGFLYFEMIFAQPDMGMLWFNSFDANETALYIAIGIIGLP
jgi:hypothetical protein